MRAKYVTRSIEATKVEVQIVTKSVSEISTIFTTVSGKFTDKNDKNLAKAVCKNVNSEDVMVVQIIGVEDASQLYGMLEADFIANAKVLDPTTRKVIENNPTPEAQADSEDEPEVQAEAKSSRKRGK